MTHSNYESWRKRWNGWLTFQGYFSLIFKTFSGNTQESSCHGCYVDEYICFRDLKITDIFSLSFAEDKSYHLPWLNCLPEDIFNNSVEPPYQRSTKAITKKNNAFPYLNGYSGKQLRYNHEGVTLENFHHFLES